MRNTSGIARYRIAVLMGALLTLCTMIQAADPGACAIPKSPDPQPQKSLAKMLNITWSRGPNLPQGLQDNEVARIDSMLVSMCGFCAGQDNVPGKPTTYPRGFLRSVWSIDLKAPDKGWTILPDFPGAGRQGLMAEEVGNKIYAWGGFSYSEPYTYRDGYQLSYEHRQWVWTSLPDLPWPLNTAGTCVIDSRIYFVGGADYDGVKGFYTHADRHGKTERLGARLLVFDTQNPAAGWKELSACPGTPRFVHATAAVQGKIYVLGGATGGERTCTVVDNWRYDPATDKWQRLRDLPIASGNFPDGRIVYQNRYLLLIGGYPYGSVMNPDGSVRPSYGKAYSLYPEKGLYSDVFVYDTQTDLFGTADSLPLTNNVPITFVEGDQVHLFGGECGDAIIEGEHYGHHPDLYLIGRIY